MTPSTPYLLALFGPIGWQEMVLLAILGVLIFGKRLPEVGKSIGQGIVEFKKGLTGISIDDQPDSAAQSRQPPRIEGNAASAATDATSRADAAGSATQPDGAAATPPPGHSA